MLKSKIQQIIDSEINKGTYSGCSIVVKHRGEELFYCESGVGQMDTNKSISRDSIFRLYSMTKPITAAAVMLLMEDGLIDLYDSVSKYLPKFKDQKVFMTDDLIPVKRDMKIIDLLNMTSGLVYPGEGEVYNQIAEWFMNIEKDQLAGNEIDMVERMNQIGELPLIHHPGEKWNYSMSADVLGVIIQVVTGQSFGEFLKDRFFDPLGMKDTAFYVDKDKYHRLVNVYQTTQSGLAIYDGNNLAVMNKMDKQPYFESGGAGLVSTIDDYMKFAEMLMNLGCHKDTKIMKAETVKFFTSHILTEEQSVNLKDWHELSGYSYGNLMRIGVNPALAGCHIRKGEYGWDGWLGCHFANFPEEELVILFMLQHKDTGTTPLIRRLRNVILSELL